MFKRLLLTGVLLISLVAISGTNAHAYPGLPGGWGSNPCWEDCETGLLAYSRSQTEGKESQPVIQATCIWSDWLGCADYEKKPTDVRITLDIVKAAIHYLNPGGNPGGIGSPFYPEIAAVVLEEKAESVSRNGKFESLVCFLGAELLTLIPEEQLPDPPNDGWIKDVLIVLEANVNLQGYSDFDGDTYPETETAHVMGYIKLNEEMTEYLETTLDSWVWKKKDQDCPFNHAPQFISEPVTTATVDEDYIYDITTSDPDVGDTLAITGIDLPGWLTLVPNGNGSATLSGTPGEDEVGDHSVCLLVTDDGDPPLSQSQSFTITVGE